jgi:predicted enzyme related to lactoylglutathione lyase
MLSLKRRYILMNTMEHSVHYLEIVTPDVKSMCDLYTKSFGWNFQPESPELGNARVAKLKDGSLCGIRAPMSLTEKPIMRMYLHVSDIEASVEKVTQEGAKMLLERTEIPGHGIIAIYEIGGIEKGLWQVK